MGRKAQPKKRVPHVPAANLPKRCAFCERVLTREEGRQGKSKEHVYPDWFLKEFGLRGQVTKPTTHSPSGQIVKTRTHVLAAYKAGRVCEGCNTGWMARLEGAAKPLLIPLMRGQRPLSALDPAERELVARWGLKTAAVVDLAFGDQGLRVHQEHRTALSREEPGLPPLISVYATQHRPSTPVYPLVAGTFRLAARDPLRSDLILLRNRSTQLADDFERRLEHHLHDPSVVRAYQIGLHLQHLVLGVFCWPLTDYQYFRSPALHEIIWLDPSHRLVEYDIAPSGWQALQALRSTPFVREFLFHLTMNVNH